MSLKQIFEGWRNHIHPPEYLKEKIEEVSATRLSICDTCPFNSKNAQLNGYKTLRRDEHCTECGCNLIAKSKCLSCKCPKDYWLEELTPEEEKTIDDETQTI